MINDRTLMPRVADLPLPWEIKYDIQKKVQFSEISTVVLAICDLILTRINLNDRAAPPLPSDYLELQWILCQNEDELKGLRTTFHFMMENIANTYFGNDFQQLLNWAADDNFGYRCHREYAVGDAYFKRQVGNFLAERSFLWELNKFD
jgi:hypothetical protein